MNRLHEKGYISNPIGKAKSRQGVGKGSGLKGMLTL